MEDDMAKVEDENQLAIDVPPAPGAVGRWTRDDEFAAYAREMGQERAIRQAKIAEDNAECNCGEQAKADAAARLENKRSKKVSGLMHLSGCPRQRTPASRVNKLDAKEQETRYREAVR